MALIQRGDITRRTAIRGFGLAIGGGALCPSLAAAADAEPANPRRGDLGDGTFLNPILGGDHPDAGAIRVGSDFYLTHSTFPYGPGLLVYHSRDLVSWRPITAALKHFYGDVWAPYLCQHEGAFYIYFPCGGRLFAVTAKSITGPWSEPVDLKLPGIDPAHIADPSGRRFLHFSGGRMVELAADGLSAKDTVRTVFKPWPIPQDWRVECVCLEAPKIFFKDGYYYLTVAQGGTAGPATSHMVVSARSRNVDGPWEYSPYNAIIHTRSRAERWWSQGHGRLVDAPDGSWWMTFHAYEKGFHSLGRQTLLLPVEWTADHWFRIPEGISPEKPLRKPAGEPVVAFGPSSDGFTSPDLGLKWQFWQGPRGHFETGNGRLILDGVGKTLAESSIAVCTTGDHAYQVEVDVEVEGGCEAGLILFYNPDAAVGIRLGPRGLGTRREKHGSPTDEMHVDATRATLRVVNDRQEVDVHYRLPGQPWQRGPRSMEISGLNHNVLGGFLSVRPGVYACGPGRATFRGFQYQLL